VGETVDSVQLLRTLPDAAHVDQGAVAASAMLSASLAFNRLLEGEPWSEKLRDIEDRMQRSIIKSEAHDLSYTN
jgi:hypothetical protein